MSADAAKPAPTGEALTATAAPADPAAMQAALAAAAAAGPFFRLEVVDPSAASRWQAPGDLSALTARTAGQLGTGELRVAASILQLSIAARLWSPVLGCGLLAGIVPDLGALVIDPGPPVRAGVTRLAGWCAAGPAELAALASAEVGRGLAALALGAPIPAGLSRGNSASAMAGALGVLVRAQPRLSAQARDLAHRLLHTESLAGAGEFTGRALSFRRRSCCLYYRVPGGGLCGDCCLPHQPGPGP
jgi:hypothetical protein